MKKYVIIGGAGFIGSHLSEKLFELGNEVVVLDNFSTGSERNLHEKIIFHTINIDDENELEKVFSKEKPDFVYHLAGVINLRRSIDGPLFKNDINFLSRTEKIMNVCSKHHVKKIIFISSGGAIYQNAKEVPTNESYLAHPDSLYGLANMMIEKYMEIFCGKNNMHYAFLRLSNVFGPKQWESGIIPSLIINFLHKKNPIIYGDGTQTRDFIFIDDVIEALLLSVDNMKDGIYNVGSGKEVSLNDLFKTVKNILAIKEIEPIYQELKQQDTKRSALDISKIQKEVNWKPNVDFQEGLKKTIAWFNNN